MRCVQCRRRRNLRGFVRKACRPCYEQHRRAGTLDKLPLLQWPRDVLIDEYRRVRPHVADRTQAARRIGIDRKALDQAIRRAALAGVPGLDYAPRKKVAA